MHADENAREEARCSVVPLLEHCPGCATPLTGEKCKVICRTPGCELFGRIIENCAGD